MNSKYVAVAQETLDIVAQGRYSDGVGSDVSIRRSVDAAVSGSLLYRPEDLGFGDGFLDGHGPEGAPPLFEVTTETTAEACRRLYLEAGDFPCALNFASAKNPGGGWLRGAKAQEEDLARCSSLYHCLIKCGDYYSENRASKSLVYTDHLIWSPGVPFFRDEKLNLLKEPFFASIITSPAPNAGEALARNPAAGAEIEAALRRRSKHVLSVARRHGQRTLVLGAWGCGVFRNDPSQVAGIFHEHLSSPDFAGAFDRAVFAIYETNPLRPTYRAFRDEFVP